MAYPSKSDGMFVTESLIFRSDSNGEDLEGYAGAGLYDSITMDETVLKKVDYGQDRYAHRHTSLVCRPYNGLVIESYPRAWFFSNRKAENLTHSDRHWLV